MAKATGFKFDKHIHRVSTSVNPEVFFQKVDVARVTWRRKIFATLKAQGRDLIRDPYYLDNSGKCSNGRDTALHVFLFTRYTNLLPVLSVSAGKIMLKSVCVYVGYYSYDKNLADYFRRALHNCAYQTYWHSCIWRQFLLSFYARMTRGSASTEHFNKQRQRRF